MLRLTCSLDPSLTHIYSAFPAEGLEEKLKSGHHRHFFNNNGMCHVLLVSLVTWISNCKNSENSELRVVFEAISYTKTQNLQRLGKCCSGSLVKEFCCGACPEQLACYFSTELASGLVVSFSSEYCGYFFKLFV